MSHQSFADQVVAHTDRLKGRARKLGASASLADDLVQETVIRALVHSDQFHSGTNLSAWLHTILRNCFFNECRKQHALTTGALERDDRAVDGGQVWSVELNELEKLVATLPAPQREALALVGVDGHSYEVAASKAGCAIGTMKSRVSRARSTLVELLEPAAWAGLHSRLKEAA